MFYHMWRYSYNLRGLYETPILPEASELISNQRAEVEQRIVAARRSGRTLLTEVGQATAGGLRHPPPPSRTWR